LKTAFLLLKTQTSKIDLGAVHNITKIKMVARTDLEAGHKNYEKFAQFEIRVGMTPVQGESLKMFFTIKTFF